MAKRKSETNGHVEAPIVESEPEYHDPPPVNRPVYVARFGSVKASVWLNQTDSGPRHAVTVVKRWRDAEGDWQNTTSFGLSDLLPLAKALDWCHTYISETISGDTPF